MSPIEAGDVIRAWVARDDPPDHPTVGVINDSLYIDGWWAVGVHLEPATFMVRVGDDGPDPAVRALLAAILSEAGMGPIEEEWPALESITLQRLGLLGPQWEVWARDAGEARSAVSSAATGEGTISIQ